MALGLPDVDTRASECHIERGRRVRDGVTEYEVGIEMAPGCKDEAVSTASGRGPVLSSVPAVRLCHSAGRVEARPSSGSGPASQRCVRVAVEISTKNPVEV